MFQCTRHSGTVQLEVQHDRRSHCWSAVGPFYPLYPLVGSFLPLHPTCSICIVCTADHSHAFIPVHRHQSIISHWTTTIYVQFVSKVNLNKVVLALQNDGTTIPQKKPSSDFQSFCLQSIWPEWQYLSDVQKLNESADSCKYYIDLLTQSGSVEKSTPIGKCRIL